MRIAHLSDLHLRDQLPGASPLAQRQSRKVLALLEQAVKRLRSLRPDILVVTGDVLDYPLDALHNAEMLERGRLDVALVARVLAQLDCPNLVIAGNHDHEGLIEAAFGRCGRIDIEGYRLLSFWDHEDAAHAPHRSGTERERFEAALSGGEGLRQVHVQHFLVWPERNEGYPHTYVDGDVLAAQIIQSVAVRLVLSGHYHEGTPPQVLGKTCFATVPAFCEAPHAMWVYDLDVDDIQTTMLSLEE